MKRDPNALISGRFLKRLAYFHIFQIIPDSSSVT
jgi:hypothetical protein